jgi:2-haloalkanoic acid dehalogenase type II
MPLTHYKVLSFGCYGTLIDRDTGIYAALRPLLDRGGVTLDRAEVLEAFERHEAGLLAVAARDTYSAVLAEAHRRTAGQWGVMCSDGDHALFSRSVSHWPAFPDSPGALQYLRRYYKLVVLTNMDRESFESSSRRLDLRFDAVYSAQEIGAYKPDPRAFEYLVHKLEKLGATPGQTLHAGHSVPQDVAPATKAGLATAWIDRRGAGEAPGDASGLPGSGPGYVFQSMADLVRAHQRQLRA